MRYPLVPLALQVGLVLATVMGVVVAAITLAASSEAPQQIESGFQLAPRLEMVEQIRPDAHAQLADGTYDTLSLEERYEFVMKLALPERVKDDLQGQFAQLMDDLNLPTEAASKHLNAALLKLMLTHDMALRIGNSELSHGKSPCEALDDMAQLYQISLDRDFLPMLRGVFASQGVRLDCDL